MIYMALYETPTKGIIMTAVTTESIEVYVYLKAHPDLALVMHPDGNRIYTLLNINDEERFLEVVYDPAIHEKRFDEMNDDELARQFFNVLIEESKK
jgi:hypothetical protein